MKNHYGELALKASNEPNWVRIVDRPYRVWTPKQEGTQCGHFMVQFVKYWNDIDLTKDREDFHVS